MNSGIYIGKIFHKRTDPAKNDFIYPIYMSYIDLDELQELDKKFKLFSLNQFNVFSFFDKDHFIFIDQKDESKQIIARENVKYETEKYKNKDTKSRIKILLDDAGFDFELGKVFALTNLRVFGYIFNPVTFYYCFDTKGVFRALVSEVNNTFGDQKMYFIPINDPNQKIFTSKQRKNFYISPYTEFDNDLVWKFSLPNEKIFTMIDSIKKGKVEVKATFTGERHDITDKLLLFLNLRYPLFTLMIIFRIHYQALKLFIKKVRFNYIEETDKKIIKVLNKE
ncbi:DUF1365 domain-containing protein [Patescibacteria group bacterium]|nr:DUF1365 domain-containing protein [Patescibacteria group bacterium]